MFKNSKAVKRKWGLRSKEKVQTERKGYYFVMLGEKVRIKGNLWARREKERIKKLLFSTREWEDRKNE